MALPWTHRTPKLIYSVRTTSTLGRLNQRCRVSSVPPFPPPPTILSWREELVVGGPLVTLLVSMKDQRWTHRQTIVHQSTL